MTFKNYILYGKTLFKDIKHIKYFEMKKSRI